MSSRKKPSKASIAQTLGFRDISVADYHRDYSAQSKSMIWDFAKRRQVYHAKYVAKTLPPEPPTKAMELGTLTHAGVLEPKTFSKRYAVYPDDCLNKKGDIVSKPAEAFRQTISDGRIVIKPCELETVRAMVASINEKLGSWLELESHRERPIYWNEPTTGLLCRCLCDWLIISNGIAYAFDLKTTNEGSPAKFSYKCEDYGYHLQDAHYSEGIGSATGLPVQFLFVVCESQFPFTTSIQKLSARDSAAAADYRRRTLAEISGCLKSGDFSEVWENKITELVLRSSCYQG